MAKTNKPTMLAFGAAAALCAASPARADYPNPKIIMQCDAQQNRLLLRFGMVDARDIAPNTVVTLDDFKEYGIQQAPADITKAWASIPFQIGGRCKFRDGRTINVSLEDGLSSGSYPVADEYFSMSVGQHIVYSGRLAYRGSEDAAYPVSVIQLANNKLLECNPSSPDKESLDLMCHDETSRIRPGAKPPEDERWAFRRDQQRETLKSALSPFCRALFRLPRGQIGDHRFPDALYVGPSSPPRTVTSQGSNYPAYIYNLKLGSGPDSMVIVGLEGETRYFGGMVLIFFPKGGKEVEHFLDQASNIDLFEANPAAMLRRDFGATLIETIPRKIQARANVSPRYSQYSLLRYHNAYYIFWSIRDRHSVPSGVLSKLMGDGTTRVVCRFP